MAVVVATRLRDDVLERLGRLVHEFHQAVVRYGVSSRELALHLLRLARHHGFRPREAHREGLSNPALSPAHLAGAIPKAHLLTLQARLNPADLIGLVEDKAAFYALCRGVGLPVPALHAVFDRLGHGVDGVTLGDAPDWEPLLGGLLDDIVIKPVRGVYGRGVRVYSRIPGGFRNLVSGELETAASLAASLFSDADGRLVIQERLRNHPEIVSLTGTPSLQTVRFQSLVTRDGHCVLAGCNVKLIGGDGVTDNIAGGRAHNFSASVRLEDGVLRHGVLLSATGIGIDPVPRHPRTGLPIEGFRLPFWDEAKVLVRRAATAFLPLRTIGWDVALTPGGPVLVEGNAWWDPPNELCASPADTSHAQEMAGFLERLRTEAAASS